MHSYPEAFAFISKLDLKNKMKCEMDDFDQINQHPFPFPENLIQELEWFASN